MKINFFLTFIKRRYIIFFFFGSNLHNWFKLTEIFTQYWNGISSVIILNKL